MATAKVSVFVFEDDAPLNGEVDVSGGTDTFGTAREPGLGGFEIKLWDDAGGTGDATGQMTYDMFNMPLSNSLQGTIDPISGLNACPISTSTDGLVGMVPTCPKFESDGKTISPLVGQAIIANLMPGRYGIVATPAADRIGRERNGCRRTRWTDRRHTTRSSRWVGRHTSRSSGQQAFTWRSALPIRKLSMLACRSCARVRRATTDSRAE